MGLSVRELAWAYSSEKCLCLSALCSANLTRTWKAESRPPHFAQVGLCVLFQRYECTHLNLPRRALTFPLTSQTTNRAEVSLMHKINPYTACRCSPRFSTRQRQRTAPHPRATQTSSGKRKRRASPEQDPVHCCRERLCKTALVASFNANTCAH